MKKLNTLVSKLTAFIAMILVVIAATLVFDGGSSVRAADKGIMDNYVLSTIYDKIQLARYENADGQITYQTYTRNLNMDLSVVDYSNLALSMKVYVKQVEGTRNPLDVFNADSLVGLLELANEQLVDTSYLNLPVKNLKRADGSDLVAGEWNDVLIPFSTGTKKIGFDSSKVTWFRLCLTRLPKDMGYQTIRLKDVNIVDISRPSQNQQEQEVKNWDTTYNVASIPFTFDNTIKDANYVGAEYKFATPVDVSKHNPEKLQLKFDADVSNLTNDGNVSPLMDNNGKAYIQLSSGGNAEADMVQWQLKKVAWKNGKATYTVDFSGYENGTGEIDLSKINYMRIFFVHTTFKDQIKIKIDNVQIVDSTNVCTVPTIFSDGMMFQQNKVITVWGNAKPNNKITVKLSKENGQVVTQKEVAVGADGKWKVELDSQKAGFDKYKMEILDNGDTVKTIGNILIGEVWLACGQSNMALNVGTDMDSEEILANATNDNLRFFLEPTYPNGQTGAQPLDPTYDVQGAYWGSGNDKNAVNKMSAVAYAFAKKLQAQLNVPVAVLNTPIGGTVIEGWIPRESISNDASLVTELEKRGLYYDEDFWSSTAGTMSTLYNQKVGPLENFKIAGAIWYQGESNSGRSELYDKELSLLKKSWSDRFGFENNSMPFIFTQVAPGQYDQGANNMQHLGYLASAMEKAFKENANNNMSMLTIYDCPLTHVKNNVSSAAIHPRVKTPVGERFATAAMNMVYGGNDVYTAPVYKSKKIKGNAIYITFDYVGKGLSLVKDSGDTLHGFSIAGSDGIYVNAKAEIVGSNRVKVYSDRVENPKNVNYAFNNFNCNANLMNSAGIPAAPFRTQTITGTDTTYNPTSEITYFTAIDWIYADKDEWVYDKDNPVEANQNLGYRPAWKAENGTYSYDSANKAEGKASVKLEYTNAGTSSVGPIVTYGSEKIKYDNFKNISVKISNKTNTAKTVALKIVSGGKTYTVVPEEGQQVVNNKVSLGTNDSFNEVAFDMTTLMDGTGKVTNTSDIWNNIEDMKFVFETTGKGSVNLDDVSFGLTEKINVDESESDEPVASYDFDSDTPSGINMSADLNKNNANHKDYFVEKDGKKCIKLGQYQYAHFAVENNVVTENDKDLMIRITYYDNSNAYFGMQYNTVTDLSASEETSATKFKLASVTRGGTNKWVTTSICVSDASFRHAQFGKYDFRVYGNGNDGTYISKIEVIKKSVDPDLEPIENRRGKTEHAEFTGKSFAGYQAWFGTGSQKTGWGHYDYGDKEEDGTSWPRKDHISIDYFPYVKDYDESALAQTGFANLGSGEPTKLFDSTNDNVIDTHFKWMNQYGIDGAAIQRFAGTIKGRAMYDTPENTLLYKMKTAAEKNNRLFYIMYDISGGDQIKDTNDTTSISSWVNDIKFDWVYNIEKQLKMTNSDAYATVEGKPVVCLWGTTVSGRPDRVADYQEMINFFHKRGCYVIFGVGRDWSTNTNTMAKYGDIFKQVDMISPWLVGSNISSDDAIDGLYKSFVEKDWAWCKNNNVDYYPVAFSGFSWALWHNNDKPNAMPRNAGQNFWYQAFKLKEMGIKSFYIAMFDEYDEGTAIAKNASDYFDIPQDQWFVTASCDGYWCSQDFQLRVAGEAIKMVKGERKAVAKNPVPQSLGPIYYRNSFESMYVNCPAEKYRGDYPVDPCFKNDKQIENTDNKVTATVKIEKNEIAKTGDYVTAIEGNANEDNAYFLYQISETNIDMQKGLKLSYSVYAANEAGKNTTVVLICDDNSKIVAKTKQEVRIGEWTQCTYQMPAAGINGRKIVGVAISYSGNKNEFKAYYDDIILEDNPAYSVDKEELNKINEKVNGLSQDDYTHDSWNNLQNTITFANSLPNTCSQEEMDDAVKAIEQAIENLVKAEEPTSQPETTTERQETTTNKQVVAENSIASGVSQHIKLNVTKKKLGKKEKLKLKLKLTGKNSKVMFKSSNAKIATVNAKGLVKAKKRGKVVIMAYTSEGATAICKITVKKAPKYVKFKTQMVEIANGKRKKLKIKLSPKSAGRVTFKSKDNKIVRVDRKGRITALKKGRTVVIAKTYNKKKAIIDIVVK
ncbi:sialate O-acetylesterase [Eubacterium sp.]